MVFDKSLVAEWSCDAVVARALVMHHGAVIYIKVERAMLMPATHFGEQSPSKSHLARWMCWWRYMAAHLRDHWQYIGTRTRSGFSLLGDTRENAHGVKRRF